MYGEPPAQDAAELGAVDGAHVPIDHCQARRIRLRELTQRCRAALGFEHVVAAHAEELRQNASGHPVVVDQEHPLGTPSSMVLDFTPVPGKMPDRLGLVVGVAAADLDELAGEAAVEQQVRGPIRLGVELVARRRAR